MNRTAQHEQLSSPAVPRTRGDEPFNYATGAATLTRPDCRPWFTERNDKELGEQWSAHMAASCLRPDGHADLPKDKKVAYLSFNGLPGTVVTLLAGAGHASPQSCAVTGGTLQSAT